MAERDILNEVIRTHGVRSDLRLWRANTGSAVPWHNVARALQFLRSGDVAEAVRLLQGRTVQFGVNGQADLTGLLRSGRRLEIETKDVHGRQSQDQKNYQAMIEKFGGVYILARSADDVTKAIENA